MGLLPILTLIVTLTVLKWKAKRAAVVSWALALVIAAGAYGLTATGFFVASGKGLALSLFVLLIIWPSVMLYHVVQDSGAMKTISRFLLWVTKDRILQCLLLSWCFAAFVQGISGFGMPVVIAAPLMVGMGFSPVAAATTTLVGHSWAVTYGSMASSYYTIQLVTSLPGPELSYWMGMMFLLPILICGFSVAHIDKGLDGLRRAVLPVLVIGLAMGLVMWGAAVFGFEQLASVLAGAVGCAAVAGFSRAAGQFGTVRAESEEATAVMPRGVALFPYGFLVVSILFFQIGPIKEALSGVKLAFDFPAVTTRLGYLVEAEEAYSAIQLFSHPFLFLLAAIAIGSLLFVRGGHCRSDVIGGAFRKTVKQSVNTTISITFMVMMALLMNDSGMTRILAVSAAEGAGSLYPFLAPFIGVLGSFMTGSNTNSNVLFGALQVQAAVSMGVSPLIMASAQSIGGSIGSAVAPAKAVLGATTVNLTGSEGEILQKTVAYCFLNVAVVGVLTWILIRWVG